MLNNFSIEFHETSSGQCPVRDFLDELKKSDPDDFAVVMAGLDKLRTRHYHRPPLSKSIGDELFELRHVGKLNTKVLYLFMKGRGSLPFTGFAASQKRFLQEIAKSPCIENAIGWRETLNET